MIQLLLGCLFVAAQTRLDTGALARLTGADTPLRPGETISFYGDSITDQGGYVARLRAAIEASSYTGKLGVQLLNRGLNGGKVWDLVRGGEMYGDALAPLDTTLADDDPSLVVVFIGVNDVNQVPGTDPAAFAAGLEQIASLVRACGARLLFATPALAGEKPHGENPQDGELDRYARIVQEVAARSGAPAVDLRRACFGAGRKLTYDGIHPNDAGNDLIADRLADGIAAALAPRLLPPPRGLELRAGHLALPAGARIVASAGLATHAAAFASELQLAFGVKPGLAAAPARAGDLELRLDPALADEEHALEIGDRLVVRGRDLRALALGTASALQLGARVHGALVFPRLSLHEQPELSYRGLLVDVARQWHAPSVLRELVTLARLSKLNYLQLHLSDDQAFTFPSLRFPQLATKGHSYSREELHELVAFADARGVTLVPELDVPGHTSAMRAALPELFDSLDPATGKARDLSILNVGKPEMYTALDALVGELCETFASSPYVHIGSDEAWLGRIELSPDTAAGLERLHSKDPHDLYLDCIARLHAIVRAHGRQTLVWEGFEGTGSAIVPIPREILVMAWETAYQRPDSLLANGYRVINASWQPLYITPGARWSPEQIFAWNPYRWQNWVPGMPSYTPIQLAPNAGVVGAQMCSWEMAGDDELAALRVRVPAFAERAAHPSGTAGFEDHLLRACALDDLFERTAHGAALAGAGPGEFRDSLELRFIAREGTVRYTLDGSAPGADSPRCEKPIVLRESGTLRWRAFGPEGARGEPGLAKLVCRPFRVEVNGLRTSGPQRNFWEPRTEFSGELEIRCLELAPECTLHFTLDGSQPSTRSPLLPVPLLLKQSADVRIQALDASGKARGELFARHFEFVRVQPNLAFEKPVRASDFVNDAQRPELAVDGIVDREQHWDSSKGAPQWLEVDLGAPQKVGRVVVFPYWDGQRSYQYVVSASIDGEHWVDIVDRSKNTEAATENGHVHEIKPVEARFVRVTMLHNTANIGLHLVELQVFSGA